MFALDALAGLLALWIGIACYRHLCTPTCSRCTMSFMGSMFQEEPLTDSPGSPFGYRLLRYDCPYRPLSQHQACRPVLFIPGNSGSFKQSRSLGSWLQSHRADGPQCHALYALDLQGQLSALSNRVLRQQAAFARQTIEHLGRQHAKPLVLVGHSMGAVVARLALAGREPSQATLITLAAPLDAPPLDIDPRDPIDYSARASAATVVNLSGGFSDTQVPPVGASAAPGVRNLPLDTVPLVWASPNHQAIVWVHPVVEYVGRLIHGSGP